MSSNFTVSRLLAVLCCSVGITCAASAATGEEWEYSQTMSMSGMKVPMPPMKVCEKADLELLAPVDKRCQVTQLKKDGAKVHWKMVCAAPDPMEGTGWSSRKGDRVEAETHIKTSNGEMDIVSKGKKTGPCTLPK